MAFNKVLLENEALPVGNEKRLLPGIDVSKWDRLHFHIGSNASSVSGLSVRILFGTPMNGKILLADSTVWYEDTVWEREFSHAVPTNYNGTGFVLSVPVVAPQLYDVILKNNGKSDLTTLCVSVMAQEI